MFFFVGEEKSCNKQDKKITTDKNHYKEEVFQFFDIWYFLDIVNMVIWTVGYQFNQRNIFQFGFFEFHLQCRQQYIKLAKLLFFCNEFESVTNTNWYSWQMSMW